MAEKRKDKQYPNLYCSHCDIKGHSLNNCKKRNDTSGTVKVMTTANEHSFTFKSVTVEQIMGVKGLLVDTGATTHIVRQRSKFIQFDNSFVSEEHTIELADDSKSHAAVQRGVAVMHFQDSTGRTCSAKLKHALYVPSYPCDIFSVHQAVQNGSSVSTPYEIFLGKRPNLKNMVPFGTLCYVLEENTNKLDDRSQMEHVIGHDRESPAYLIYDKHSGSVKRSRNVVFDIVSSLYDKDVTVLNRRSIDMIHDFRE